MTRLNITFRYIVLCATLCLLSGCLGGSIASSIASSIATRIADKAVANALDVQDGPSNRKSSAKNAQPDPYQTAFMNAQFEPVKAIAEPIPETMTEAETPIVPVQTSQLVRVELFNLLIGEEKNAVYEQARLIGASNLPQKREWPLWCVGTGVIQGKNDKEKKTITFLIPPEFGKLPSGSVAVVELANPGNLNIARYKVNENAPVIKTLANR